MRSSLSCSLFCWSASHADGEVCTVDTSTVDAAVAFLSWSHVEIGHYVHEPLVSGSSCSLSGFTLHGAMLGSTVGTCYASAPGVFGGFLCEGELVS